MASPTAWYQNPEIIRAILGAGGAGLETFSQYQQSKSNREQNQNLSRAATLQGLYEGDQGEDFLRERTALDATQLNPHAQLEADQRQAIRAALLSDISNVTGSFNAGTGQGSLSGGINLANLQRPDVQNFFSPDARLASRKEFDTIRASAAPNVPIGIGPDGQPMGSYAGYGQAGADAAQSISQFGQQRFQDMTQRRTTERESIMRALEGDIQGQQKKKGGGFWKTLGKIGAFAAPIVAAPFTGGTSLALIGAGAGAANAALSGGGIGSILAGAGMGAAGAGMSDKFAGQIPGLDKLGKFRPVKIPTGVAGIPGGVIPPVPGR